MGSAAARPGMGYRPEIDGLRAVAVLAVIVNHIHKPLLPSGYLGVDVFFVISGFVVTGSLASRPSRDLGDLLLSFHARRIKRLVPALLVFVLITSLATCLLVPVPQTALFTGLASLFGLSNIYLIRLATDYFASSTELNPFTHTWFLGVDLQFYLLFPLLVWWSGFGRRPAGGRWLLLLVGSLSAASLLAFVSQYAVNPTLAYFSMPTRFWELGAGCLLFLAPPLRVPCLPVAAALLGCLVLPLSWAVPATIAAVVLSMLLVAGLRPGDPVHRLLASPPLVRVGLLSYSLYLWHWGVLSLSRWSVGLRPSTLPWLLALIVLLAWLSYRYVETPLRGASWSLPRWRTITYGLGASSASAVLLLGLGRPLNLAVPLRNLAGARPPEHLRASWGDDRETGAYLEYCHVRERYGPQLLRDCLPGTRPAAAAPVTVLIGDSHARNYLPSIRRAFPGHASHYLTMGHGCAYLPDALIPPALDRRVDCSGYRRAVREAMLASLRPGDLVFVGQALGDGQRTSPAYLNGVAALAADLEPLGVPLVLLDSTAPPTLPPEACFRSWQASRPGCSSPREEVLQRHQGFDAAAQQLRGGQTNLFYAPLRDGLCVGERCGQTMASGAAIWHDSGHITEAAAADLGPLLRRRLEEQGLERRFPATAGGESLAREGENPQADQ